MPEAIKPVEASDLEKHLGKMVHVKGWNRGAVFVYRGTFEGTHRLETPKTKKIITTKEQLLYTNRNKPCTNSK